jgi:hypothetical protein
MNTTDLIREVRRRAGRLDELGDPSAVGRFAYPVGDGELGMAETDAVESVDAFSATFVITDSSEDRDGDRVNPRGVRLENWKRAGAPVFWGHQEHPFPIGTCLNPRTGALDVWPEENRIRARVHFDMEDPSARFIAGKVKRGLIRATSVAFVPVRASRRGAEAKAQRDEGRGAGGPMGWDFHEADMTELSIVGVGSNRNALLEGAPAVLAKALRRCAGGRCFTKWAPPAGARRSPAVEAAWKSLKTTLAKWATQAVMEMTGDRPRENPRGDELTTCQVRALASGRTQEEELIRALLRNNHRELKFIAEEREGLFYDGTPRALIRGLDDYADMVRAEAAYNVKVYDDYRASLPEREKGAAPPPAHRQEILARYGMEDDEDGEWTEEEWEEVLARYRPGGLHTNTGH